MYILTIHGKETEGAYSVTDEDGDQILYLFEEEDDATRFAMMLEEDGYPELHIIEVEDEDMINCLLYTSPSPRDYAASRMPSSA